VIFYNSKQKILAYLIILLLIVSLSGCKSSVSIQSDKAKNTDKSFPVTITDDLGRKVTLKAEPKRIVSIAPSNTEILFYLGLGKKVIGDTTYCDYPEEAKHRAKVGGFKDPSLEKIVALKPDLVFATGMHQELIKGMEDAGLNVLVFKPDTIEGIFNTMEKIGKAAGVEDKAITLTKELKDRVNAVSERAARIPENQRPTVYYEM
jgi:iron complex transport system substrate-binding protein